MRPLAYHRPRCLAEALALHGELPGSRFIAGGTDLMVQLKERRREARALISLREVAELKRLEVGETTRIGAAVPLATLEGNAALRERYPALAQAVLRMGSVQIRNVATLGGNLCNASPAADGGPPLLVLDARVRIRGAGGARELAVHELLRGPGRTALADGEVITEILIGPQPAGARTAFRRVERTFVDLAIASVAVRVAIDAGRGIISDARVAAGAVAPVPLRLHAVEELLVGGDPLDEGLLIRACGVARETVAPISDLRASAGYRRHVTGVLVQRALRAAAPARPAIP